jgi:transcriptional/translational regulatory protein YebC/TACO1
LTTNDLEEAELMIIETGAKDIQEINDTTLLVITEREEVQKIYNILAQKFTVDNLKIIYRTNQLISIDNETQEKYSTLLSVIDELDDVQEVFDNLKK